MSVLRSDTCFPGALPLPGFAACGDSGHGMHSATVNSFVLPVPTPVTVDQIVRREVIPADSNIIPTDFNVSSLASLSGAVHLSISLAQTFIGIIFGGEARLPGLIPQHTGLSLE